MITLKGKVKGGNDHSTDDSRRAVTVGERWEIPFLNASSLPGHWLHSIRFTPEPSDKVLIEDIRVGNNSVFAGDSGQAKAQLLNQFPLAFKALEVVPPGSQVRLILSGAYDGLCDIELISPITGEHFIPTALLRINSRTQIAGKISELIITQELRKLIAQNGVVLSLWKNYPEEFAHQFFEKEISAVSITPDGHVMLNPPVYLEIAESLTLSLRHPSENEPNELFTKVYAAHMMAILDPTTRWET